MEFGDLPRVRPIENSHKRHHDRVLRGGKDQLRSPVFWRQPSLRKAQIARHLAGVNAGVLAPFDKHLRSPRSTVLGELLAALAPPAGQ